MQDYANYSEEYLLGLSVIFNGNHLHSCRRTKCDFYNFVGMVSMGSGVLSLRFIVS